MSWAEPERACLVIADISGYTGYLAGVELDHAQDIVADLVSTVVGSLRPAFRLSKLEGDAAFAYVVTDRVDGSRIQDVVEATYFAFRRRLRDIGRASRCECNACVRIPALDLKVVVHHGSVIRQRIAGREELLGPDVIVVHRLLKNDVVESTGIAAYALYTAACVAAMDVEDPAAQGLVEHRIETDVAGEVVCWLRDLGAAWAAEQERTRVVVEAADSALSVTFETAAPPSVVWDYLTAPGRRMQWQADTVTEASATGRRGTGTINHCIHGKDAIVEEILDYRPYEHVTTRFQMPVPGSPKGLTSDVLTPLPGGGTRVETRFARARPKDAAFFEQIRPMIEGAMEHSIAALGPLLAAEASARAGGDAEGDVELPEARGRHLAEPVTG